MKKYLLITLFIFIVGWSYYSLFVKIKIEDKGWKYSGGYSIGDVLDFGEGRLTLRGDTLHRRGKPVALFDRYEYRVVDYVLIIYSLDGRKKGYYVSKWHNRE